MRSAMKKITVLLMLFFVSANAQEWLDDCCTNETPYYAKLLGGVNFLKDTRHNENNFTYKAGYILAASLGYNWRYGLSLEGEYAYRRNEISRIHLFGGDHAHGGHFQTSSFMANLLWNVPSCVFEDIQPFIGAGIGYDFQKAHSTNSRIRFNQKWNHFAWQLIAGIAYPIYCNTNLTLEYKFHQGGCHFYNHTIGVGLVYNFGVK